MYNIEFKGKRQNPLPLKVNDSFSIALRKAKLSFKRFDFNAEKLNVKK